MINLIYMAKPIYGGWVTFTAHLSLKYNCELFKIGKRCEKNKRKYGYGVDYQNLSIDELVKKENIVITAVDKHYWEYLHLFPENTKIIIHDPTELKGKENKLLENIYKFHVITIRKSVQDYIQKNYNIESEFLLHPFYNYPKSSNKSDFNCLSISRIDFDKHTDLILKANQLIKDESNKIQIFGAENRLYVHHKLKDLDFQKYWKGKYPKELPLKYNDNDLLNDCKYVIDMSIIKGDGGGTQYTFLEAIYHDCALILHKEWVEKGDTFKKDYNCYVVGYTENVGEEIANIINNPFSDNHQEILENAKKLLQKHIDIKWF